MGDLIMGVGMMGAGIAGLIGMAVYRRGEGRRGELRGMNRTELHAELTRCTGAIMTCARKGNRRGMRHAYQAMKPVMRAMQRSQKKCSLC